MHAGRGLAVIAILGLLATPVAAGSDAPSGRPDADELRRKIEEAVRGLVDRVKPAFDRLLTTLEVLGRIDSLEYYEEPEVLPNGDIIIRRRPDAPPLPPPEEAPEGAPELDAPEVPGLRI